MSDKTVAADVTATSVLDAKDPGSRNDIPGWCERSGHEYLGEKEGDGFISFFIKKG